MQSPSGPKVYPKSMALETSNLIMVPSEKSGALPNRRQSHKDRRTEGQMLKFADSHKVSDRTNLTWFRFCTRYFVVLILVPVF